MSRELPRTESLKIGDGYITFTLQNGVYLVSSVELADAMDRANKDVLKTLRKIEELDNRLGINGHQLVPVDYTDENNQPRPMYLMDESTVFMTIGRMQGDIGHVFMRDFHAAYTILKNIVLDNLKSINEEQIEAIKESEMLKDVTDEIQYYEKLGLEQEIEYREMLHTKKIEEMEPAFEHGRNIMMNVGDMTIQDWATNFSFKNGDSVSRTEFLIILREIGYIQIGTTLAYHAHVVSGMFRIITTNTPGGAFPSTAVTGQGYRNLTHSVQTYINTK